MQISGRGNAHAGERDRQGAGVHQLHGFRKTELGGIQRQLRPFQRSGKADFGSPIEQGSSSQRLSQRASTRGLCVSDFIYTIIHRHALPINADILSIITETAKDFRQVIGTPDTVAEVDGETFLHVVEFKRGIGEIVPLHYVGNAGNQGQEDSAGNAGISDSQDRLLGISIGINDTIANHAIERKRCTVMRNIGILGDYASAHAHLGEV